MNSTTELPEGVVELYFSWLDYGLFMMMILLSIIIGIYFGFCGKKEDTPKEYIHGGKTMSTLPVTVSLIASFISGITIMGDPAEIYTYGGLFWMGTICTPVVALVNNYMYLPVFYELQVTSVYEYLQLRFNRSVRIMASVLCTVGLLLYIPIVIYVPALALNQVTGLELHYITSIMSIICIFYTMLGGIKGVVWTDFLQGTIMVVATIVVIILGLVKIGGFGTMWERSKDGGRLHFFDMDTSPFKRMSFWSVVFGGGSSWIGVLTVNQASIQRFLSLPTYDKAQKALIFLMVGTTLIKTTTCFMGLLIYATYYDCDPMKTKVISRSDQLLPYYVMDIAGSIPGLPGLFVAGVFSAALSTMSTALNSLGATLFEDFVRPCLRITVSDKTASNIMKCIVVVIGVLSVFMVLIVDKIGGIVQLAMSTNGVASGATFGLFTFGMFYRKGTTKGALVGSIVSLLVMGWIVFGAQMSLADGSLKHPKLPTNTHGCGLNFTLEEPIPSNSTQSEVFILYRITFMYYTFIGFSIMFVLAVIVSHFTEAPDVEKINPALFSPVIRKSIMKTRSKHEMKVLNEKNSKLSK